MTLQDPIRNPDSRTVLLSSEPRHNRAWEGQDPPGVKVQQDFLSNMDEQF